MINLTKVATAAGVGVVDEYLERQDNAKGRSGFQRWSAIARAVAVVGGYLAGEFMPKYQGTGETIAVAATPLLVKTLAAEFATGKKAGSQDFVPRNIGASARNWVPADLSGPAGYRPISVNR